MNRTILLYIIMLFLHISHVFEEIWGEFTAIDVMDSLGLFLTVNLVIFALVLILLYTLIVGKRWAFIAAQVYAVAMIVNGIGHNAMVLITGRYFGGFAGSISGVGLAIAGVLLFIFARAEMPGKHLG